MPYPPGLFVSNFQPNRLLQKPWSAFGSFPAISKWMTRGAVAMIVLLFGTEVILASLALATTTNDVLEIDRAWRPA